MGSWGYKRIFTANNPDWFLYSFELPALGLALGGLFLSKTLRSLK